jgi:hypothetical protein
MIVEVKTRHSFHGCRHTDLPSSASHRAGWVDAIDLQDRRSFMASEMSHSLGVEEANVLSPSFINSGAGFERLLWLSLMT